jgi:formate-dependent nitrite reductase cytochrome c552 subunit
LKVDRSSAPLLLDAPAEKKTAEKGKGPKADNHACHVCHTNYEDELLALTHADADVGCVKCHGESIAHRNDENNITPPDTMYPTGGIDSACVKCHETHDAPARKVLARFAERCPNTKAADQIVCTDCHGDHRLKLRSVRWDKKTGKLLTGVDAKAPSPSEKPKQ